MTVPVVLLATRSVGKLRELKPLFASAGIVVEDLREAGLAPAGDEDAVEAFDTFSANALAKARYFHALTGRPVVADDSGLEVGALDGKPGVRSKRRSDRTDLSGQALDDDPSCGAGQRVEDAVDGGRLLRHVPKYSPSGARVKGARLEIVRGPRARTRTDFTGGGR